MWPPGHSCRMTAGQKCTLLWCAACGSVSNVPPIKTIWFSELLRQQASLNVTFVKTVWRVFSWVEKNHAGASTNLRAAVCHVLSLKAHFFGMWPRMCAKSLKQSQIQSSEHDWICLHILQITLMKRVLVISLWSHDQDIWADTGF